MGSNEVTSVDGLSLLLWGTVPHAIILLQAVDGPH